ncbi:hypothetical protein BN14_11376 [Rhizoctonia solani AG-1 IB]|uniref:Uncharacterized protein n=1 Tax=Thanatephorus cucumeris (strain AG1-IB / isolate 7/3/14) TaxID=1108050 RepID=M5CH44_THACB|nr:hypothetical protein BN14_11376 [Rhizoctonia solani AG-1 IB]
MWSNFRSKSKRKRSLDSDDNHLHGPSSRPFTPASPQPTPEPHASVDSQPTNDTHMEAPDGQGTTSALNELRSQTNVLAGKSGAKSKAWAGLRVSLKSLRDTPAMFGPVVSAADVLLDSFDTIEAAARNQQDYEYLATELEGLSISLVQGHKGSASSSGAGCVIGFAKYVGDLCITLKDD